MKNIERYYKNTTYAKPNYTIKKLFMPHNKEEKNKKDEYLTGLYLHSAGSSPGLYSCDQL